MNPLTLKAHDMKELIRGDVLVDHESRKARSRDASLFEVMPEMVIVPQDSSDIQAVVKYVNEAKKKPDSSHTSISVRAAGSCMSGGSLNDSLVLDTSVYMRGIVEWNIQEAEEATVRVLPGTFYREFEPETLKRGLILPCFTASKNLCALGGMIGNNAAGEKTLHYGKMEHFVREISMVCADGNEYRFGPLTREELKKKCEQKDFEGSLYRNISELIEENEDLIESARPHVSKNSAGYYLWNVWNKEKTVFDLTRLIVGSQGTLGIVTEATLALRPVKKARSLLVVFMPSIEKLGDIVKELLNHHPETLESYDDSTLRLAFRFLPELVKSMKVKNFIALGLSFLPEAFLTLRSGIPKFILLAEFTGEDEDETHERAKKARDAIRHFGFATRIAENATESEKYWTIRHESFNLLRTHIRGKRTAPFVDDVVVNPEYLPQFLPRMREILDDAKLLYTIAGHAGNGNFHVIPLMDLKDKNTPHIILDVSKKIYSLVHEFQGSITAEHNDGIIRTPFLQQMYGEKVIALFKRTKEIFDPLGIFNPGKKVGGTLEDIEKKLIRE